MEYQLEIQQLVDYPRCRIYRKFIRSLMDDPEIRKNGKPGLASYMVLCSHVNYRASYRRVDGIGYTIYPGEWVCPLSEISEWFHFRYHHQALSLLDSFSEWGLLTYRRIGRGKIVRYKIKDWEKFNTVVDYNAPCCKDDGFFFFPFSLTADLVSACKCSEADIVLDLWLHTIYRDSRVDGSELGPVVYYRDGSGKPMVTYADLGERWGLSKATVCRSLQKMVRLNYLSVISFGGNGGSVIYLKNYLSTMFAISDVTVDKEEVSMRFGIRVSEPPKFEQCVSNEASSVSNSYISFLLRKVLELLGAQGIPCCECPKKSVKLYPLSDCKENSIFKYELEIGCERSRIQYRFSMALKRRDQ